MICVMHLEKEPVEEVSYTAVVPSSPQIEQILLINVYFYSSLFFIFALQAKLLNSKAQESEKLLLVDPSESLSIDNIPYSVGYIIYGFSNEMFLSAIMTVNTYHVENDDNCT